MRAQLPVASPADFDGRPLVVLSPHLDDAVISVGGLIARVAASGSPVRVVSVYTAYPPRLERVPPSYRRLLIYDWRRDEDRRALKSIGADPVWLDFCERAALQPALSRPLGVFSLPRPATLGHFHSLAILKAEIAELVSSESQPIVLAPAAVGGHIDHVEVFLAAALVMLETGLYADFRFYEDAYAMCGRGRRRHFLASRHRWHMTKAPALAGPVAAAMLTGMGWAGRGPRVDDYLPPVRADVEWRCERFPLGGYEPAKLAAMKLYESQMESLGGYRTFSTMVERWHRAWDGAELLWTAQPGACLDAAPRVDGADSTRR